MRKEGFTLVELLIVMLVVAILTMILIPAASSTMERSKRKKAEADCVKIATAIQKYWNDYNRLPVPRNKQGFDPSTGDEENKGSFSGADAREIIKVLVAHESTDLNPRERVYLQVQSDVSSGEYLDPWGEQYVVVLDVDYNGEVKYPPENKSYSARSIVMSYGRDKSLDEAEDNVCNLITQ